MKAVVFKDIGEIELKDVAEPEIKEQTDAIVKITTSAICGTDLHLIRGTLTGMKNGTILGHEAVGIVEKIGSEVHNFKPGDRVIIPSTIACGACLFCKRGLTAQCDNANPHGSHEGTAFFGGPSSTGPFNGLQAEKARVPFADAMLIAIPNSLSDDQVILISDILPTAFMGVEFIEPKADDSVAVFGAGPVGQLVIACLKKAGVKKIFSIDRVPSRLAVAEQQEAHPINFDNHDPVKELLKLTNQKGADKVIDAVGIDADHPATLKSTLFNSKQFKQELEELNSKYNPHDDNWKPGTGPSQTLQWAVESVIKGGIVSVIGVYSEQLRTGTIGAAMEKNLTIRMGNCNHRTYIPRLVEWVNDGVIDLLPFITKKVPFGDVIDAYKHFDRRDDGWLKVILTMR